MTGFTVRFLIGENVAFFAKKIDNKMSFLSPHALLILKIYSPRPYLGFCRGRSLWCDVDFFEARRAERGARSAPPQKGVRGFDPREIFIF